MKHIFARKTWKRIIILATALLISLFLFSKHKNQQDELITANVETGTVTETISISGFVEAKHTAELAFPTTGKVTEVFVNEGDVVEAGEILATLGSASLAAERNEAMATLRLAQAQLQETVAGASNENVNLALTKVSNAEAALQRITNEENLKVTNARQALMSNQLEAVSDDPYEKATTPTVTGTYTCMEGAYNLSLYSSNNNSGFSYNYSGPEKGINPAYTDQPAPLGNCGLYLQFSDNQPYSNSQWSITIPNVRASNYVAYKNAYDLAIEQKNNAIAAAENALNLAREEAGVTTASARPEVLSQKQAAINQAQARVAAIDARLADYSVVAPFPGIVTDVTVIAGETATTKPVITLLAEDAFELTARVPEIDITKVAKGQKVAVVFDANIKVTLTGEVSYVSPLATEIDGVAYFETTIQLTETPDWLRSGLNADVDVIIGEQADVLKLPKRFINETNDETTVNLLRDNKIVVTPIEILFTGNDGYVALDGLTAGDEVVAP